MARSRLLILPLAESHDHISTCLTVAVMHLYMMGPPHTMERFWADLKTITHQIFAETQKISDMDCRPPSPSARFYVHQNTSSPTQMSRYHQPAFEATHSREELVGECMEQFGHSLGLSSAPPPCHHEGPHPGAYGHQIPEEMISPRMPIPNPAIRGQPRSRVHELTDSNDVYAPRMCGHVFEERDRNTFAASDPVQPASKSWPPHYYAPEAHQSPLPMYRGSVSNHPVYSAAPAAIPPMNTHGLVGNSPDHSADSRPMTFRVPSYSMATSLESVPEAIDPLDPDADLGRHPSDAGSDDDGDRSTIYPGDSASAFGASPAPAMEGSRNDFAAWQQQRQQQRRQQDLANSIVAVHDVCLGATQRYLETLRANWDLRNGEVVSIGGTERRPGGGHNRTAGGRWSPYAQLPPPPTTQRRARSEADLAHMAAPSSSRYNNRNQNSHHQEINNNKNNHHHHHHNYNRSRNRNPLPAPTTSLLDNIHHISALLWRRAQRDRDDVPGAEAAGCRAMAALHARGEAIVVHRAADLARDPAGSWGRVLRAGRGLCRELGDGDAVAMLGRGHDGEEPDGAGVVEGWL